MKKISLLIILMFTFLLTGCGNSKLENLSLKELKEKLNNKDTFIVYFAKEDSDLESKLNAVLENNNLKGYKFDTNKISDEEKYSLQLSIPYEEPSIVFVIKGQDPSKLSHVTDEDILIKHLEERLKDMQFIN